ncbi:RNA polymerase sigma-70 factor [Chitinophaga japonensis]|uniref:RNA polymerase sigma-70 factor (ECF subfamily) n=1 Tax=Chitinophaga japonensis TaxID=104662 RepID=A0A562SME1_CHIJA|nr:RNA polymerase sigma-70 factor [Chitinophaga japonensis]TWI82475.1 RNA polymerase sigma-70 factor (ECF subfamily) [Chitinophaga japonensis]
MYNLQGVKELYDRICLKSDLDAYRQLFQLMENPLIAFIRALVGAEEVAEELYSDLFVKIWARRHALPLTAHPRNYIYTMARNLALDHLKKERHLQSIEFNEINTLLVQDQAPTPEEQVISKEMVRKIEGAINVLPARCRLIFKMVKEDGFKHKEVAALLGISVNTVEVQMSIALKKVAASVKFKTLV